ncbi:MAG: type IV pilus assembly protein PilM [Sedimentisphaerales bacterium]|nr:type IV pilus assembly protein PilM [Sedimentisphaerales bacterium]
MASSVRGVWAIDIGTCSLKALRVRPGDDGVEVVGFDHVEHSQILSGSDINLKEKHDIIAATLRQFLSQNEIGKDQVAISIAGQNSFARFIKLPPVEPKKIPEIVQFEAVQQIPFDINEVEWDWQKMDSANSPDAEVGIFAIKNELIAEIMDHFTRENLNVTCVQISPMALFNYLLYDRDDVGGNGQKATVILDMGAENSTLVICTKDSVWQRSIRIGGNTFTHAIADAFKLDFEKAEKLKRTAPMSKYMRQIYTAMKPVYTELSGELQRSLGFYSSSGTGRDKGFSQIIALGGGMKLQGLTKYLQQSLGLTVVKPESFEKLRISSDISSAKLHENICDFGVVYGLSIQMMGQGKIMANLLPRKIARTMAWNRKARMFTVAAAMLAVIALLSLGRAYRDLTQYNANAPVRNEVSQVLSRAQAAIDKVQEAENQKTPLAERVQKQLDLFKYRDIVPALNEHLIACLPNASNTPDQTDLFEAFMRGDVQAIRAIPRPQRKQVFVTRVMIQYAADLSAAAFPEPGQTPVFSQPTMMMQGMPMTPMQDPMMMMEGGMGPGMTAAPAEAPKSGFVVLIEGYSPYRRVTDLLDPPGVAAEPSRWGIITRFENLGKFIKGSPFELFNKNDTTHFKVEWGTVEATATQGMMGGTQKNQPIGIGILNEVRRIPIPETPAPGTLPGQMGGAMMPMEMGMMGMGPGAGVPGVSRISVEKVLIDPMTGEEISKVYDIFTEEEIAGNPNLTDKDLGRIEYDYGKPRYIERDSWFRIKAKFFWKDAPKTAQPVNASGMPGGMSPGGMIF